MDIKGRTYDAQNARQDDGQQEDEVRLKRQEIGEEGTQIIDDYLRSKKQ